MTKYKYGDSGKYSMPAKKRGHGAKGYWIVNEGYYMPDQSEPMPEPKYDPIDPGKPMPMRFCRMFPDLPRSQPDPGPLTELGVAMSESEDSAGDPDIPAGMTYLGQFVDHDITRTPGEGTGLIEVPTVDRTRLKNERTASLDLDSLYGAGPDVEDYYQSDKQRFVIGETVALPAPPDSTPSGLLNDLPRDSDKKARIGDNRNDENLAVAQTHLAFLKFHNQVVDTEAPANFEAARKIVRQHYHSIVWHDFVPRLVDPAIYDDVAANGRNWWMPEGAHMRGELCMPVEFSVAAYRLGHSMIRNTYEWNRIFRTGGPPERGGIATLQLLFDFSGLSGNLGGFSNLPANWIIDWSRFHDFTGTSVPNHATSNKTRPIDTKLAEKLGDLPEFQGIQPAILANLAVRNLIRGSQLGLATGQDIANAIGATPLTAAEVASGDDGSILKAHGFDTATPLWYYILKEAEVKHGSQHLGAVGSTITVETFHGLIEGSQDSIFKEPGWKPSLPSVDPHKFTMADMLVYVDDINPLGSVSS